MSQSITKTAITEVSKEVYAQSLKALGFKRKQNHMYRFSQNVIHGIHFQGSQWGTKEEGKFTINLVVTSEDIYSGWTGKPLPTNLATALFPITQRIGSVMPDRMDLWWDVNEDTDLQALGREITKTVFLYGIPFLDRFPNEDTILECLQRGEGLPNGWTKAQYPLVHAILAKKAGNVEEAKMQIEKALMNAGHSLFSKTILTIAQRIGIVVN